jgi:hypothetical protein
MFMAFYVGALIYCTVTLVFLILSSAAVPGSGISSLSRLAGIFFAAVFWPVTLAVLVVASALPFLSFTASRRPQSSLLRLAHFSS